MDKLLFQAFKNLPDTNVPDSLHASIVRAAIFRRSWNYAYMLTFIISLTFLFSLWHLYTRVLEAGALSAVKAVANTFEFSVSSVADSATTLFDFLPVQSLALSILNFIALIFMIFLLRSFIRIQGEFTA